VSDCTNIQNSAPRQGLLTRTGKRWAFFQRIQQGLMT
jgi:hypothetical protein